MNRENFRSRLGFILVSAGCAIGIGNVWKFPYLVGKNGGGLFVLIYLLFLIIMGIPVMTMELAIGRASRRSGVGGYKALQPPASHWDWHGWVAMLGCLLLMMYYTTVSGWMLSYFGKFAAGTFSGITTDQVDNVFGALLANPAEMLIAMAITVIVGFLVCSFGLQRGLERVSKVMMVCLLGLIIVLAIHSISLPGAIEGVKFYLLPNLENAHKVGLSSVIMAAMNQSFFTLSLGIGAMEIFGSYMSDEFTLGGEAVQIAALDTFVAIVSGLIIFPACFSFGVAADKGPSLIFVTLPRIFVNLPGGRLWGALFFLFMTFASFSTVLAVFENLLANAMDNFGWSRKKAVLIFMVTLLVLSVPCVLGYNVLKDFHPLPGKDILDTEDFFVSNLLLPIGSLIYLLFCVTRWGWNFDAYLAEVNKGRGLKLSPKLKPLFRYVLPVLILIILIQGLI